MSVTIYHNAACGGIRPTQGRTLAVMRVCGGSQSFGTVNALRAPGRWMRMVAFNSITT